MQSIELSFADGRKIAATINHGLTSQNCKIPFFSYRANQAPPPWIFGKQLITSLRKVDKCYNAWTCYISQLAKMTILPSPPTGWRNWPLNEVHISHLNWRQIFPCHNIHVYPISIYMIYLGSGTMQWADLGREWRSWRDWRQRGGTWSTRLINSPGRNQLTGQKIEIYQI